MTNVCRHRGVAEVRLQPILKPVGLLELADQYEFPAAFPPGKPKYTWYRRLGGPRGRCGEHENVTGIRTPDRPASNKSFFTLLYTCAFYNVTTMANHLPSARSSETHTRHTSAEFPPVYAESDFDEFIIFLTDVLKTLEYFKWHENPSSGNRVVPCGRTDRHDVVFRNFANAPKSVKSSRI
jgi:hypothetical protein